MIHGVGAFDIIRPAVAVCGQCGRIRVICACGLCHTCYLADVKGSRSGTKLRRLTSAGQTIHSGRRLDVLA
ncbi:MAG: hypothetical protein WC516_03230 [Patescibacteria group bacterium]